MTRERHVLFFGDSFVAGVGDATGLGWVGRVVAASYAAGHPVLGYNLGVRRDTSADVERRWREEAGARLGYADAAQAVALSFGVNDMTEEDGRLRVAPDASVATLQRLVGDVRALGLDVLVVGPPPAGEAAHDARVEELSTRFAEVTAQCGVPYVETFGALVVDGDWAREAAQNDGAHPAAGGYAALAGLVLAAGWIDWIA
ncbi:MAG TPA: GDSL-type esterase/lipase family protein [Solirubrobacteraceae bacterium]|jgi:lysophospholipase L1-like esterase|nr:GDSL-type esterase/lipase family protein [Solirubrobacteraceae bacterium]